MRRAFHPNVEGLESHTLLSGLGVSLTLTTDQATYTAGQPVHMTLTETNTTDHEINIVDAPSSHGFLVRQNGAVVWQSNNWIEPMYARLVTLAPGQSFTLQATWDGHPSLPMGGEDTGKTVTGALQVDSQVRQDGAAPTPINIDVVPPPGKPATKPPATAPVVTAQPLAVTVTTDRASARPGQPIVVTVTETNRSTHDVPVLMGAHILSGTATGAAGPVWVYRDARMMPTFRGVLHPGQTRKLSFVWNGTPDLPGARVAPGVYTIRAGVDGVLGTATVRIAAK